MKRVQAVMCTILLALSSAAQADSKLSYNFAEAGGVKIKGDNGLDADGYAINLSGLISETLYLTGNYADVETDPFAGGTVESTAYSLGLGFRSPLSPTTDFTASAAFVSQDLQGTGTFSASSNDDTGFGLTVGVRARMNSHVEFNAGASYVDIFNDDSTSFGAGAVLHINPAFAVTGDFSAGDNSDSYRVGLRLNY